MRPGLSPPSARPPHTLYTNTACTRGGVTHCCLLPRPLIMPLNSLELVLGASVPFEELLPSPAGRCSASVFSMMPCTTSEMAASCSSEKGAPDVGSGTVLITANVCGQRFGRMKKMNQTLILLAVCSSPRATGPHAHAP